MCTEQFSDPEFIQDMCAKVFGVTQKQKYKKERGRKAKIEIYEKIQFKKQ